jgi:hypothetical protein
MAAPKGNNFAGNALIARKALIDAIAVRDGTQEPKKGIERYNVLVDMWDKQIEKALDGDNDSFKHIVERLDGKAPQDLNLGGQENNPIKGLWSIQPVRPVNAADSDS